MNWKDAITEDLAVYGETWTDVEAHTLTSEQLVAEFDSGWGGTEGEPFTVWSKRRVYFPVQYDGSEWVDSVSRDPDGKPTSHLGG